MIQKLIVCDSMQHLVCLLLILSGERTHLSSFGTPAHSLLVFLAFLLLFFFYLFARAQDGDLSEPYSIFTYRYFLTQWPQLWFLVCTPFVLLVCCTHALSPTTPQPVGCICGVSCVLTTTDCFVMWL